MIVSILRSKFRNQAPKIIRTEANGNAYPPRRLRVVRFVSPYIVERSQIDLLCNDRFLTENKRIRYTYRTVIVASIYCESDRGYLFI